MAHLSKEESQDGGPARKHASDRGKHGSLQLDRKTDPWQSA
jgi:hypothetical protein